MRRVATMALIAVASFVGTAQSADDPRQSAAAGVFPNEDRESLSIPMLERGWHTAGTDDDAFDDPRWKSLTEALAGARVRLVATAFRVRAHGGPAREVLGGDALLVNEAARQQLREAVAAGALTPIGRVALSGSARAPLVSSDVGRQRAALAYDTESSIGAAVSFPAIADVVSGLEIVAEVAPHAGEALVLAFNARLMGTAESTTVASISGPRIAPRVPVFVASGALTLGPSDLACVRGIDARGTGFVLLLRARVDGGVRLPMMLGSDHVALPTAALCHVQDRLALGRFSRSGDDERPRAVRWERELSVETRDLDRVLSEIGLENQGVDASAERIALVRTQPGSGGWILRELHELLATHSTCVLSVTTPGHGRVVVPFLEGGAPTAFLGEIATRVDRIEVQTGCDDCITATEEVEDDWAGLAVTACARSARPLRIDIAAREFRSRISRALPVRRLLAGHATCVQEDQPFEFATTDDLKVTSFVPAGGALLAREIEVRIAGRGPLDWGPTAVDVNGERVYVAGDGGLEDDTGARLARYRSEDRVLSWASEGSCGMTLRSPELTRVGSGLDVCVLPDSDLSAVVIDADVSGPPITLEPAFDSADGVVELIRSPQLRLQTIITLGAERRLAWGSGMELRVGSPDIEMQRELRTLTLTPTLDATVESTLGELGVRFEEGARLHFEAGGHTLLPVDLDVYTSNHESGEISTSGVSFSDGVRVTLAESAGHVARGLATLRGPSSLRAFDLRKFQAPRRADTAARLSLPTYPHRSIPLTLPDGRALDFTVGTHAPWRISVAAATAEDDE